MHSTAYRDHACPLFQRYKVLKFADLFPLENCISVIAFSLFSNHFKLTASSHSYCARSVSNGLIFKRLYNIFRYGSESIINSTASTGNHFQTIFHGHNLLNPIQDRLFWGCSRMGGGTKKAPLPKICYTYPTTMKLGTLIP